MPKKITPKTKLSAVLAMNEKAGKILFELGFHCVGCPMAMQETLEEGCKSHGMRKKEINELIGRLNE